MASQERFMQHFPLVCSVRVFERQSHSELNTIEKSKRPSQLTSSIQNNKIARSTNNDNDKIYCLFFSTSVFSSLKYALFLQNENKITDLCKISVPVNEHPVNQSYGCQTDYHNHSTD